MSLYYPFMRFFPLVLNLLLVLALAPMSLTAQPSNNVDAPKPGAASPLVLKAASTNYLLAANDVIHIKVYREEELDSTVRLAKDGTIIFPLIGSLQVGGKTTAQATTLIRDLLAKDYLVNPQVSLSIVEFAKRRFTVLGEVQRPGAYDLPEDQSLNLLQAISMAGGYTRIAAPGKVTVQRQEGEKRLIFPLDAKAMSKDKNIKVFEILPEDTITVGESIF
jgi:protein involved in polysaccharide export with SLBB domain